MKVIETEEGLLIPKEKLERLGAWEVEEHPWQVIVRAKDLTEKTRGMVGKGNAESVDSLIEAIKAGEVY